MKHFLPRLLTFTLVMALGAVCVNTTHAQFFDNFDGYSDGEILSDPGTQNGWQGWDLSAGAAGVVSSAQSQSAPHSISIGPTGDAINQLGNPTSGKWNFTVDQYLPLGTGGDQFFIMQNTYNDGGPYNWSVELRYSGATDMVTDDFDPGWAGTPIIYDVWVPIQVIIDLDNDTVEQYYDGVLIENTFGESGESWSLRSANGGGSGNGVVEIGAVDLFSNGAQTIYYDNLSLAVFVDEPVVVPGETLTVAPGTVSSGGLGDLTDSDNASLVIFRDPTSTAAVTQFVLSATSPSASPSAMDFVLEGRCVSRPNVVQRVEMFDFTANGGVGAYETLDEQNAARQPPDLSITVTPTGDLSRFVDPTTNEIRARVRYRADSPRANFSSRTDQAIWMITP